LLETPAWVKKYQKMFIQAIAVQTQKGIISQKISNPNKRNAKLKVIRNLDYN